ncbi:MAG: type II secretion system protein [Phycisphaeraceae bacterium]|nr:type II secretion system protein [Phycisphaeraceae bacterium]
MRDRREQAGESMRGGRENCLAYFEDHRAIGFTLIEVLVVLSIIVILMAILLPVLAMARRVGVRTACQSNLHGIGAAIAAYTMDNNFALPTYFADPAITFDTFRIRTDDGRLVNLGVLLTYAGDPRLLYCPSQTDTQSPSIAYDAPANRWRDAGTAGGPRSGGGRGPGEPDNGHSGPRSGVNASYTVRLNNPGDVQAASWNIINFTNKVIYSDFIGVDGWPGRGRFVDQINSPHESRGYNRLFGDSSVIWTDAAPLNGLRPINDVEPSPEELNQYYLLFDVLH